MIDNVGDEEQSNKPIKRLSVFYYGVGHMLNDITSACWFTYLLVFLTEIGLPPRFATLSLLISSSDFRIRCNANIYLGANKSI